MPTADHILSAATALANDWRRLAILWHVALAALLVALFTGGRPSHRLVGCLLVLPVMSVNGKRPSAARREAA